MAKGTIRGRGKMCARGNSCGATCISRSKRCVLELGPLVSRAVGKASRFIVRRKSGGGGGGDNTSDYSKWKPVAEGNYGKVSISPDGTRAVKELLTGKDGKKGQFGEHEVQLAKKMGELGHSPRIYKATDKSMEMDVAKGATLWKGYARGKDEPVMNATQATKAAAAIKDLHKMGFAHGDMHALQFIANGNNIKLVDYGLSAPISANPVKALHDLSKISKLVNWDNPELAGNPYVQLVNKYLPAYREVKGTSKKAKEQKQQLAEDYIRDLKELT
jgi:tRNA A-37 threonylcarbamoyl transferase component Bud32